MWWHIDFSQAFVTYLGSVLKHNESGVPEVCQLQIIDVFRSKQTDDSVDCRFPIMRSQSLAKRSLIRDFGYRYGLRDVFQLSYLRLPNHLVLLHFTHCSCNYFFNSILLVRALRSETGSSLLCAQRLAQLI